MSRPEPPVPSTGRLKGKVAIITGAGSGIGRASALRFASEGAMVVCADLDLSRAEAVVAEVEACAASALALEVDVRSRHQCESMANASKAAFGRIDVLYANAGIGGAGSAEEVTEEAWHQVLEVNLTGTWLSIRAVLPVMRRQQQGTIVIQSSVAALVGFPGNAPYTAAKGGLAALARQINAEYLAQGIRVNSLCPGTVDTELVRGLAATSAADSGRTVEEEMKLMDAWYPIGRLGTVDEIAAAAAFLASDDSSFVCGTELVIDGGLATAVPLD